MEVRIRETGAIVYENEFRAMFPNTSFHQLDEATLDSLGADVVFEGPQATGGTVYQYSQRDGVEQVDGKWYTKHILGPVFRGETAAADEAAYIAMKDAEQATAVRADRDRRLAALDWTQSKDIPDSISAPAAVVRQALRDVPLQAGFPWTIEWPDQPE